MEIAVYNFTKNKVQTKSLITVLERAAKQLKLEGEVSVVLAGDQRLRRLNQTWRGLDKSTDVLSFSLLAKDWPGGLGLGVGGSLKVATAKTINNQKIELAKMINPAQSVTDKKLNKTQSAMLSQLPTSSNIILGEIFINLADCRRTQKYRDIFEGSASFSQILHFLAIHGLLHLAGLKDDTEAGRQMMIRRGWELLKK